MFSFRFFFLSGYGDQYLHRRSRIFGALYAIVSVGMLSTCLSGFEAAKTQADEEKHYRKLMRQVGQKMPPFGIGASSILIRSFRFKVRMDSWRAHHSLM